MGVPAGYYLPYFLATYLAAKEFQAFLERAADTSSVFMEHCCVPEGWRFFTYVVRI